MTIEFFQTPMGRTFFDSTMPALVKALVRIADVAEPHVKNEADAAIEQGGEAGAQEIVRDRERQLTIARRQLAETEVALKMAKLSSLAHAEFVDAAKLVAQHWRDQEGVNAKYLDRLAAALPSDPPADASHSAPAEMPAKPDGVVGCKLCAGLLLFSARARGNGLCGPCDRVKHGQPNSVDLEHARKHWKPSAAPQPSPPAADWHATAQAKFAGLDHRGALEALKLRARQVEAKIRSVVDEIRDIHGPRTEASVDELLEWASMLGDLHGAVLLRDHPTRDEVAQVRSEISIAMMPEEDEAQLSSTSISISSLDRWHKLLKECSPSGLGTGPSSIGSGSLAWLNSGARAVEAFRDEAHNLGATSQDLKGLVDSVNTHTDEAMHATLGASIGDVLDRRADPSDPSPNDEIEERDFYELMQAYRHAPIAPQSIALGAFANVKKFIRALIEERSSEDAQLAEDRLARTLNAIRRILHLKMIDAEGLDVGPSSQLRIELEAAISGGASTDDADLVSSLEEQTLAMRRALQVIHASASRGRADLRNAVLKLTKDALADGAGGKSVGIFSRLLGVLRSIVELASDADRFGNYHDVVPEMVKMAQDAIDEAKE